jgi:hypothetical protein
MSRYPYTDAADYIRSEVTDFSEEHQMPLPTLSRSQASRAYGAVAKALGMTEEDLAIKLADYAASAKGEPT